mmetsp:Transcript_23005/g.45478  ORF Transcript_23005/g.45478 Transcript_23005/m.45478 type:complete len:137 (-) Transcript_23005:380-790(-)|eukprot:CAMPEP_0175156006 /NCGR_PEP_ID=MMETSP0087-20121206/21335_1 /TAXON_ID=136419 /ORGANISM="Unknown Unknown, Strain D1" /LENGTH=136 /DNA_ID=CAMNT_0016443313 /DNA_START=55 /DNA_END=465 /DNA_ORIENTATION=-
MYFQGVYADRYLTDQMAKRAEKKGPFQRSLLASGYKDLHGAAMQPNVPHQVPVPYNGPSSFSVRNDLGSMDPRFFDAGNDVCVANQQYAAPSTLYGFNKNETRPFTYHVPGYQGHIPNQRDQFGETFSNSSRKCNF